MEWKFLNDPVSRIMHFGEYLFIINWSAENAICPAEDDLVIYEQHYISGVHLVRKKKLSRYLENHARIPSFLQFSLSQLVFSFFLMIILYLYLFLAPVYSVFASCFVPFPLLIEFKSFFVLPGKIQEVIVCTHFPYIPISPLSFSPAVQLLLPICLSMSDKHLSQLLQEGNVATLFQERAGSQSKETQREYLSIRIRRKNPNYYCTALRSPNNTLISTVHIPFESYDTVTV